MSSRGDGSATDKHTTKAWSANALSQFKGSRWTLAVNAGAACRFRQTGSARATASPSTPTKSKFPSYSLHMNQLNFCIVLCHNISKKEHHLKQLLLLTTTLRWLVHFLDLSA